MFPRLDKIVDPNNPSDDIEGGYSRTLARSFYIDKYNYTTVKMTVYVSYAVSP